TASVGLLTLGAGATAGASTPRVSSSYTCKGALPAGAYESIVVKGLCFGPTKGTVLVGGGVTVDVGGALAANYPSPGKGKPEGDANWKIAGSVMVKEGGAMTLGCSPHFGCKKTTSDVVGGGLEAAGALGVIVHSTSINGNVVISGGGGGLSCAPSGVFKLFGQPVYSDLEDSGVTGSVTVSGLASCWLGLARDAVAGNVTITKDKLADPDAIEIVANAITGNLACSATTGAWDSAEAAFGQKSLYPRVAEPNAVVGKRSGQCVLASPATQGGPAGPGPF
ncbi:MAG: hypothetical protein ACYCUG_11895, partial [Acidimicrobiales bacterium]